MTTEFDVISAKHDIQNESIIRVSTRLDKMEEAVTSLAVQNNMIINAQNQVDALWRKYDTAFGPDGTVSKIKNHQMKCPLSKVEKIETRIELLEKCQSACPGENNKKHLYGMWLLLAFFGSIISYIFNFTVSQAEKISQILKEISK
jgi:hypothetical protein